MRVTVEFDPDTAKAVERVRQELGVGVSQAVNELIRRGLVPRPADRPFRQRTQRLGIRVDISHVAASLDALEGVETP